MANGLNLTPGRKPVASKNVKLYIADADGNKILGTWRTVKTSPTINYDNYYESGSKHPIKISKDSSIPGTLERGMVNIDLIKKYFAQMLLDCEADPTYTLSMDMCFEGLGWKKIVIHEVTLLNMDLSEAENGIVTESVNFEGTWGEVVE
jgi:hypothetical protein